MDENTVYIAVESFKGGVGKTTAALNLARLLQNMKYQVLILDLDITGTNINEGVNSIYWNDITHVISWNYEGQYKEANLLDLFDRIFMKGKNLPRWDDEMEVSKTNNLLSYQQGQINIFGSQFFNLNDLSLPLMNPSILFDEIHVYWLFEFIKELVKSFIQKIENSKLAVIFDTSPGYVGLSPYLQDWISDLGPEKGKSLIITSFDRQDIKVAISAIDVIYKQFCEKSNTASFYKKSKKNNHKLDFDKVKKEFYLKLIEYDSKIIKSETLEYYLKDDTSTNYDENPKKFLNLIINKVPREIKAGMYELDLSDIYNEISDNTTFEKLFNKSDYEQDIINNHVVSYDSNIEFQFFQIATKGRSRLMAQRVRRFLENIEELESRTSNIYIKQSHQIFYSQKLVQHYDVKQLYEFVDSSQMVISTIQELLAKYGLSFINELLNESWFPSNFNKDFKKVFNNILFNLDIPLYDKKTRRYDDLREPELFDNIIHRLLDIIDYLNNDFLKNQINITLTNTIIIVLSQTIDIYAIIEDNRFNGLLELCTSFAIIQSRHWESVHKDYENDQYLLNALSKFLANDKLNKEDKKELHNQLNLIEIIGLKRLNSLYSQSCKAQARLLDIGNDVNYLLNVIKEIVKSGVKKSPIIPDIKMVVNKVIISKTIEQERGMSLIMKEISNVPHMKEFELILAKIAKTWNL